MLSYEVSFKNDDFIADLDSDNISQRILGGSDLVSATNEYYKYIGTQEGDERRIREFLRNNPYKEVEDKIIRRISVVDEDEDGKKTLDDIKDSRKYKDAYDFLYRLATVAKGDR